MNQQRLEPGHELVVDLFAGGGGASTGIEAGIGRTVDIAVNHDPLAVAMHRVNHPRTRTVGGNGG
jgi:DNA (cytosine-5)-methyltransferase 1